MTRSLLMLTLCGVLLTGLFWTRLWRGGGFIGGDTYTYFLPQKAFLADRLQAGELPFWNYRTGHGYPLIGESQTAVFYPVNWLLYGTLDLNTAYVASHLLHYVLAFVGMGLLARRLGLNGWGSLLAAIVYVYGWFPPRACLEWAIIGGVFLPWTLWCLESWFATRRIVYGVGLALLLALDLLAGHFNLAFITTVALGVYALLRTFRSTTDGPLSPASDSPTSNDNAAGERAGVMGTAQSGANFAPHPGPLSRNGPGDMRAVASGGEGDVALHPHRLRLLAVPLACMVLGYLLAAPQLVPSWSLKRASQRTVANAEFDPGYGHIPPWYLCQMATPWLWFGRDADPDRALNSISIGNIAAATNKVEAHLYFGLVPLLLTVVWIGRSWLWGVAADPRIRWLGWIGLVSMIYATGWLLPLAEHLPGFGYFRGPGRWGILTTLAVAVISGRMLMLWTGHKRFGVRYLLTAAVLALTIYDLHWVSRHQWYTFIVSDPPIAHRQESEIGQLLSEFEREHGPPRMLAPGPNLATLCGHAASPPYLGFGPDAYYLDGGQLPDTRFLEYLSGEATPVSVNEAEAYDWLRQAGVTHILSMKPLPPWLSVTEVWRGMDRLLNPAWARADHRQPLYLYAIGGDLGRLYIEGESSGSKAALVEYAANHVEAQVHLSAPGTVILTDLPWPEWELTVNGVSHPGGRNAPTSPAPGDASPVQRIVELEAGEHRLVWRYRPRSLWWGCAIALGSAAALVVLARRMG